MRLRSVALLDRQSTPHSFTELSAGTSTRYDFSCANTSPKLSVLGFKRQAYTATDALDRSIATFRVSSANDNCLEALGVAEELGREVHIPLPGHPLGRDQPNPFQLCCSSHEGSLRLRIRFTGTLESSFKTTRLVARDFLAKCGHRRSHVGRSEAVARNRQACDSGPHADSFPKRR